MMEFHATKAPKVLTTRWLSVLARIVSRELHIVNPVSISFVSSERMRRFNRLYRAKDKPTDILSFRLQELAGAKQRTVMTENGYFGEIVLCMPYVRRRARMEKASLIETLHHLIIHGVVHLSGFDHSRTREAAHMEGIELSLHQELKKALAKRR